jgi:transcriptional regulator with XRE-family HTH domain
MVQIPRLREWRELQGWTQKDLARESGVSPRSIAGYEAGAGVRPGTARKLAEALNVEVADLVLASGKVEAPPSPEPSLFNGLEEERRAEWEAAVADARQLRGRGQGHMRGLLAAWQTSKDQEEGPAERQPYLDQMGELLQEAYDAENDLWRQQGGVLSSSAPISVWEEIKEASRFYGALLAMVQEAGLHVRTSTTAHRVEHAA